MHRRLVGLLTVVALLVVGLLPTMAQDDVANVRVAHFSQDAPAVDVYVNGDVVLESVEYPAVSEFLEVPAGTHEVAVAPAGTSVEDAVIGPVELTFDADTFTTVAAVGLLDDDSLTATVFTEDYGPTEAGNARVTFVHGLANGPNVDMYGSDVLLVQNLRFPSANSDGAFTREVPAGNYNFEATLAESPDRLLLDSTERYSLEEGEQYIVAAIGSLDAPDGFYIASTDEVLLDPTGDDDADAEATDEAEMDADEDGADMEATEEAATEDDMGEMTEGTSRVRVGHFSPDAPAVDVYVDGDIAFEGLEYPALSEFAELPAGTYEIAVSPAGEGLNSAVIGPVELTFEADTNTTVAAVGLVEDETLRPTVFTEDFDATEEGFATATFLHAVAGGPNVDIYANDSLIVQNLRFPSANSDGAFTRGLPAGNYDFEVTLAADPQGLLLDSDAGLPLEEDGVYFVAVIGTVDEIDGYFVATPEETLLDPTADDEDSE